MIEKIREAAARIRGEIVRTPLVECTALARAAGIDGRIWLKDETRQRTGSFKIRPAMNGLLIHLDIARERGVIASSSGNFAQAVADACRSRDVRATIVMMSGTSPFKVERTRALGAEVVLCENTFESRWKTTYELQARTGALLLHPYDTEETIAGSGTVGLEIDEDCSEGAPTVLVPVSGGGLLAGVAVAVRAARPGARIFGVQPSANGSMARSLAEGRAVNVGAVRTRADALIASQPGERTFVLVKELVAGIVPVEEDEISAAADWLARETGIIAEPGGAVGVAALLSNKARPPSPGGYVVVLSGGNVPGA